MDFRILGPLEVRRDGSVLEITTPKQRALLVLLLLNVGRAVSVDRLIDQLWAGDPPPHALVTLRSYVSNLRRALDAAGAQHVLVTRSRGYAVEVDPEAVDAVRLERLVEEGRAALSGGDAVAAIQCFDAALALWRGEPLADVAYEDFAQGAVARLEGLRLSVEEGRFQALLSLGRHAEVIPALEAFVAEHPLREQPRAQLMVALYRSGRAPDALRVYRQFRELLAEEMGLDPSASLEALAEQILNQAPELDAPRPRPDSPASPGGASAIGGTRVVGRRAEIGRIMASVARLSEGRGGVMLLSGEPGIGKSTLLEYLAAAAADADIGVHWGRAPSAEGAPAFWPWTQVLRSVAAGLDDDELAWAAADVAAPVTQLVEDVATRLGSRQTVSGDDPRTLRFRLYDAVTTFLTRASSVKPLVALLDDIQWADVPSLELLAFATPHLADARIFVAAAYRDLPAERSASLDATLATVAREDSVDEINLRGLPHDDVAALAADIGGKPASDDLVTLLHERTAGNPFFIRHLARLVCDTPATSSAGPPAVALPAGIRRVLTRRLQAVPADTRRLLDVAAVAGREFDLKVVSTAAGLDLDDALDAVDIATGHGLVERHGRPLTAYRFAHALVHEAVSDELPPGRAARLHAAVANALETVGAPVDQLAEQMWRAADLIADDRPLRYTLAAADAALRVLAYEQAELYLRRALELAEHAAPHDPQTDLTVRLRLFQLIASTQGWGSSAARDVVMRVRELADVAGLQPELVPLWWALWTYLRNHNDLQMADEVADELLRDAKAHGDPIALAVGYLTTAFRHFGNVGGAELALAEVRLAKAAADQAPAERLAEFHEHLGVIIRTIEAQAAALAGDPAAHRLGEEAIKLADEVGRPFPRAVARTFTAWSSAYTFDPRHALDRANDALALCDRFGFNLLASLAVPAHAWASAHMGEDPQAQASRIVEAIEGIRATGNLGSETHALTLLAEVRLLVGDFAGARTCLARAKAIPGGYPPLVDRVERELASR